MMFHRLSKKQRAREIDTKKEGNERTSSIFISVYA